MSTKLKKLNAKLENAIEKTKNKKDAIINLKEVPEGKRKLVRQFNTALFMQKRKPKKDFTEAKKLMQEILR